MTQSFNLDRFVTAQAATYATALAEIRRGAKRTHWMWFIFPQLVGLGHSANARFYGIVSLAEARAYMAHSLLGSRLAECVTAMQGLTTPDPQVLFGSVDAAKLRSSLTLFEAAGGGRLFGTALDRWFGSRDEMTLGLLTRNQP